MLNWMLDRTRLARPVSSSRMQRARAPARSVGHGTSASGQALEKLRSTRNRPDVLGRKWVLTGIDRTLALWRLISTSGASGQTSQQREHLATGR
jgi:hypothetical protein